MSNYWSSSPYPHEVAWPQTAYHDTHDAKQVNSPAELEALGPEWSTNYADKKRAYPKMKFRPVEHPKTGALHYETAVVATPEDEGKLEGSWSDVVPPAPAPEGAPAKPAAPNRR